MSLNGMDTSRSPVLTYGQINAVDLNELGTFLANLASSQLLTPDNNLEDYLRELAGLPTFRPQEDGAAVNTRYNDLREPPSTMTDHNGNFIGANTNGAGTTNGNTESEGVKNPQGGVNDQSGGSGLQANITSAGYTGEAPPQSKGGKPKPTGQNSPLTNNQGTTS